MAAGSFFDVAPEDVTPEDFRDAISEIANIVGGNIKALLPEPCDLSVPSARLADGEGATDPAIALGECLWFVADGESFAVSLSESA